MYVVSAIACVDVSVVLVAFGFPVVFQQQLHFIIHSAMANSNAMAMRNRRRKFFFKFFISRFLHHGARTCATAHCVVRCCSRGLFKVYGLLSVMCWLSLLCCCSLYRHGVYSMHSRCRFQ